MIELERRELDEMMADLIEHPTVSMSSGDIGDATDRPEPLRRAADIFYGPDDDIASAA